MTLRKPPQIAASPFKSAKWDEVTEGCDFKAADVPTLTLLCQWYEVIEKCISDISDDGDIRVAYMNDTGDVRAMPQLSTMKQASAEIRALNKQLGINDEAGKPQRKETKLYAFQANRKSRAANKHRAAGG